MVNEVGVGDSVGGVRSWLLGRIIYAPNRRAVQGRENDYAADVVNVDCATSCVNVINARVVTCATLCVGALLPGLRSGERCRCCTDNQGPARL